jgi:hypothetical protein
MVSMRCHAALAVSLALALGACGQDAPPMPSTCTQTDVAGYERALTAAPHAVALPGGTKISTCLNRVRTDADLQTLGAIVHAVAEHLVTQASAEDGADGTGSAKAVAAARRYGFLTAAVSSGAGHSNGIAAELARRVETAGISLRDDDVPAAVARALDEGLAAGRSHG